MQPYLPYILDKLGRLGVVEHLLATLLAPPLVAILAASFELPDKIFSNQNLNTLTLELITPYKNYNHSPYFRYSIIRCTNLRVLILSYVHITPYLLYQLLSMNKLLETIFLGVNPGLNEIKVNNLRYLRVFEVCLGLDAWIDILVIRDAPSLRSLLRLNNVHMNDAFSNMIKSNFPFLEELTLEIKSSSGEILDITSLTLWSSAVPILLFTTTPPEQIELLFSLGLSIDGSFFLKMREALKLSSKFNIQMSGFRFGVLDLFNVDDVKTIVSHPAINVEQLLLKQHINNNVSWENSLLLDAVFSICHPIYAKTNDQLRLRVAKYLLKLILKGMMESYEIKNPLDGRWVALTSSYLSLLDTTNPHDFYEFKLSWCSP
ncbi:F-box protein-like protein [Tanacetum coccineum]